MIELAEHLDAIQAQIRACNAPDAPAASEPDDPAASTDFFGDAREEEPPGADDEPAFDQAQREFEGSDFDDANDGPTGTTEQERRQSLDALLDSQSIKTLFRQLARRLHPDREPDPERKRKRDELMARAAQARDHHDLFTLLSMYQEHVGASPFEALGEDEDKVLELLKSQTAQLREQQREIRYATPFRSFINTEFAGGKRTTRERRLREHCDNLGAEAAELFEVMNSISSIATLRPFLQERYDDAIMSCLMP